jgi:hypothetical protein
MNGRDERNDVLMARRPGSDGLVKEEIEGTSDT